MLNENMKALRKNKGLTQEELANRLNVVRQTVSKWEKGLSVPDAEMLQKIADVLESDVSQLLGAPIQQNENTDVIAEQLSRINEQLAVKNNRSRKIWKAVGIILAIIIAGQMLLVALGVTAFKSYEVNTDTYEEFIAYEHNRCQYTDKYGISYNGYNCYVTVDEEITTIFYGEDIPWRFGMICENKERLTVRYVYFDDLEGLLRPDFLDVFENTNCEW